MAYFPPTTIVKRSHTFQRQRLLPRDGEVVVRTGQEVSAVQVVARAPQTDHFHVVPASTLLKVSPEEVTNYLLVEPGTAVEIGMPLLRKGRLLGRQTITSPVEGVVHRVLNGRVILQQKPQWLEVRALVAARIVNHIEARGATLAINGSLIQAIWSNGKEGVGPMKVITDTPNTPLTAEHLTDETSDHILTVGYIDDPEILQQAQNNGITGLIVGSLTTELYERANELLFPVIITDGIGRQSMTAPAFHLLQLSQEFEVSILNRSESSNNRPEIIVAQPTTTTGLLDSTYKPLAMGSSVRILRTPYENQVGEVTHVYTRTQTTSIRAKAVGADVKLQSGEVIFIPLANLEILQS